METNTNTIAPRRAASPALENLVLEELDGILRKSHRPSPMRRGLRAMGGAFARWLERAVPPAATPDSPERPPQIRFPFF